MPALSNPPKTTHEARLAELVGWLVVGALVGLSIWAVAQVQLEKAGTNSLANYWYLGVFLLCEFWAAAGLVFLIRHWVAKRRAAFWLALGLWLPALLLSGVQEYAFHEGQARKKQAETAPQILAYTLAETREEEIARQLAGLGVQRPVEAIQVELARYEHLPNKYPTKIAALKSELALSERYQALLAAQSEARQVLQDTAHIHALYGDVSAPKPVQHWLLIIWMMTVKAFGAFVISGRGERVIPMKQTAPNTMSQKALDGRPMRVLT